MKNLPTRSLDATELLRNIHHAVCSPISSLLNLTEIVLSGADGAINDEVRNDVTDMAADVARLQAISANLLELCRLDSAAITSEPLDVLEPVLCAVYEASRRARDAGKNLYDHLPAALPPVRADAGCVYDLVIRLASYIFRFTEQATIRVDAGAQGVVVCLGSGDQLSESASEGFAELPDNWLRDELAVELLVCKRLAEVQGGLLWASGAPGCAPILCFWLPAEQSQKSST